MTITSLMDDYCPSRGLRGEHGLSLHIDTGHARVLFDAGQGGEFIENARRLGIDLKSLDAVVLSHGHYDHGGGLKALFETLPVAPPLFAGKGFDVPRKARSDETVKDIGLPSPALPAGAPLATVVTALKELAPRSFILPCAERLDGSEALPRFRVIRGDSEILDEFDDELSLVFDTKDGIVIVTGCAHRGILNIARASVQAFPGRPIKALVGGFHLVDAPSGELSRVARGIADLRPEKVLCAHCTGPRGFAALTDTLRGEVSWLSCGMRITL